MKIVKKLKGVISWHFYRDDEMQGVIKQIMDFTEGKQDEPLKVLTNLFKGTEGDEIADLYLITSQDENRMYIDNEQKKLIINIRYEDLDSFISCVQLFLKDKKVSTKEMIRIMISKKEYSLLGFNQQYKRFIRIAEKREKDRQKMLQERQEKKNNNNNNKNTGDSSKNNKTDIKKEEKTSD